MDWTNPWITGPLCAGLGIVLGLLLARLFGGEGGESKAVGELRAEFDEYREGVSQHFDTTSELFKDMTEKYRDVYNHMAGGAQAFGGTSDSPPRLEIVSDVEKLESANEAPAADSEPQDSAPTDVDSEAAPQPEATTPADDAVEVETPDETVKR